MAPLLVLPFSMLMVVLMVYVRHSPYTTFFATDQGLTMAVAQSIGMGEWPLVGPPSHIGGRHLGPLYYWYQGFLWVLAGENAFRTILFDSVIKMLFAGVAVWLTAAFSQRPSRAWSAVGASLAVGIGALIPILRDSWQPHLLFPTVLLFWWAALRVLEGRTRHLGWVLVSASAVVQAQYAAGVLVLPALLSLILTRDEHGARLYHQVLPGSLQWRNPSVIGAAVALLILWAPPLVFEVLYPSNIAALAEALSKPTAAIGKAGLVGSLKNSISFINDVALGIVSRPSGWPLSQAVSLFLVGSLALPVAFSIYSHGTRPQRFLIGQTLLALGLFTILLSRQKAPLERYFLYALVPSIVLCWGLLFGHAVWLFSELRLSLLWSRSCLTYTSAAAVLVLLPLTALKSNERIVQNLRRPTFDRALSLRAAEHIGESIAARRQRPELLLWGSAKLMGNAYLYFAGPEYWNSMHQGADLKEISYFRRPTSELPRALLVACPVPNPTRKLQIAERLSNQWKLKSWKSCGSRRICGECALAELKRIRPKPSISHRAPS